MMPPIPAKPSHIQWIHGCASDFRRAIDQLVRRGELRGGLLRLAQFPRASCQDASMLLGTYLKDSGLGVFDYVFGWRRADRPLTPVVETHGWLEQGDIVVDITADQFTNEAIESVVVSRHSEWHLSFAQQNKGSADYRDYADTRTKDLFELVFLEASNLFDFSLIVDEE